MRKLLFVSLGVALLALATLAGCGAARGGGSRITEVPGGDREPVRVASGVGAEGELLGQMILLVLEKEGIPVRDRTGTGATDLARAALLAGEIDVYPEYTGTAIASFFSDADVTPGVSGNATESYDAVRKLDAERNGVEWLARAPASAAPVIAISKELSAGNAIFTMEDFAMYVNDGGTVKLAAGRELAEQADGLAAFQKTYGFELSDSQLRLLAGADATRAVQAAARGSEGVSAAMAHGTDGGLAAPGLVVMSDPRGAQAVLQPAPTIRGDVLDRYPKIAEALDPVFESLTPDVLRELNRRVTGGEPARGVAESYLRGRGFR